MAKKDLKIEKIGDGEDQDNIQDVELPDAPLAKQDQPIDFELPPSSSIDNSMSPAASEKFPLPNGGLDGEALSQFIATHGGPKADIGFNPNHVDEQPTGNPLIDASRKLASITGRNSLVSPTVAPMSPQASPSTPSVPMDTGYGAGLDDEALKAAQAGRATSDLYAGMGKSGAMIGAALSRGAYKADNSVFDDITKNAGNGIQDILTRRESKDKEVTREKLLLDLQDAKTMSNANSPISKALRDGVKIALPGYNIPDNVSGSLLHSSGLNLSKLIDAKIAADARKESASVRGQDRQDRREEMLVKSMSEGLDPNKARAGNMAFNQKKVDSAERLEGLIFDSNNNISNLDSRQMEELAIGLQSMLSNSSNGSAEQVKHLVPQSAIGKATKLQEWLTNEPHGTNQIAFVKRMSDTIKREKEIAQNQVRRAQVQRLSAWDELRDINPKAHANLLQSAGIDEKDIDAKGQYHPKKPDRSPQGSQYNPSEEAGIKGFMEAHPELDRAKAIKILTDAGRLK